MRIYDIIEKKKTGKELTREEIRFFVEGYSCGDIPDYQAAALCMAIWFNGMTDEETAELTFAVRDSGDKVRFSDVKGVRVDKHSTGGVGDKTSLAVMPIVAALGVKVAKMSGRGLGHTGGTVDKLESIKGFNCSLGVDEFQKTVNERGIAIIGQSGQLAPADKKLYALRDVTATVDSIPLIASSIMGKKLALDDDCIVLDVKTGSGSFMKSRKKACELARVMVNIGKNDGRKMLAMVTDMDQPLGRAVGNSLEVIEAINTLKGKGPADFTKLCVELSANMLALAGFGDYKDCRKKVLNVIKDGSALKKFRDMVEGQGGDPSWIDDTSNFPKAKFSHDILSDEDGYIHSVNAEEYGIACLILGAGRNKKEDEIDPSAGMLINKKRGDYVKKGEVIATLYSSVVSDFSVAEKRVKDATFFSAEKPKTRPLIIQKIY